MKLDARIPGGPLADKWDTHRFEMKLVNPANKRKFHVIVVGSGLAGASAAFKDVLARDPNHFPARFFLAVCNLNQGRSAEAEVGLTACIAQRPRFTWNYLFRGQAYMQLGE